MGARVKKERAGGRWSEARYFSFIRSALRKASMSWPVKSDVLAASRRARTPESGAGNHRYEYECAGCRRYYQGKNVAVDHLIPAGTLKKHEDLAGFVSRLYCEADGLQVLCTDCHQTKTNLERGSKT